VELTGGLSQLDSDGYLTPWKVQLAGLNLNLEKFLGKLQITHSWISNRFGLPDEDFQETRIQAQYVW